MGYLLRSHKSFYLLKLSSSDGDFFLGIESLSLLDSLRTLSRKLRYPHVKKKNKTKQIHKQTNKKQIAPNALAFFKICNQMP